MSLDRPFSIAFAFCPLKTLQAEFTSSQPLLTEQSLAEIVREIQKTILLLT
jgi:hypothetical protein